MPVADWTLRQRDEQDRLRERDETQRLLAVASRVTRRTDEVALKVRRMTQLYQERLNGTRPRDGI